MHKGEDAEVAIGHEQGFRRNSRKKLEGKRQLRIGLGSVHGTDLGTQCGTAGEFVGQHQVRDRPGAGAVLIGAGGKAFPQGVARREGQRGAIQKEDASAVPGGRSCGDDRVEDPIGDGIGHIGLQAGAGGTVGGGVGGEGVLADAFVRRESAGVFVELVDGFGEGGVGMESLMEE